MRGIFAETSISCASLVDGEGSVVCLASVCDGCTETVSGDGITACMSAFSFFGLNSGGGNAGVGGTTWMFVLGRSASPKSLGLSAKLKLLSFILVNSVGTYSSAGLLPGELPGLRPPLGIRFPYNSPVFCEFENAGGAPKPKLPRGTGTPPILSKRAALSRTPATELGLRLVEYEVEFWFDAEDAEDVV